MMRFAIMALALLGSACGDIGNVRLNVQFPDEETELRTRALLFVVRDVPKDGNGCVNLWRDQATGLAENRSIIEYPNRNDVVAAPVRLAEYPKLTLLVYAHPSRDITTSTPIAGGCIDTPIDAEATQEVVIQMETRPGS